MTSVIYSFYSFNFLLLVIYFFMPFKRILMAGFSLWVLLGTTNAFAQPHQHEAHSHHQSHMVSPFDRGKEVTSLHCLLKGHTNEIFCPHSKPGKGQINSFNIAADCGGKNSGTVPATTSSSSHYAESHSFSLNQHWVTERIFFSAMNPFHRSMDSLDPPPIIL